MHQPVFAAGGPLTALPIIVLFIALQKSVSLRTIKRRCERLRGYKESSTRQYWKEIREGRENFTIRNIDLDIAKRQISRYLGLQDAARARCSG